MKKLTYFLIFILIGSAGWLIYSYYFLRDPATVTRDFYNDWISGSYKLSDDSYQNVKVWTDNFKNKIGKLKNSAEKITEDPILCSTIKPDSFLAYEVSSNEEGVQIEVREDFSGQVKTVRVYLKKIGRFWLINDISCHQENIPSGEQNLVSQYISANISELSPQKEVLGGKFYVNSITFGENQTGEVEYEDGHILLRAKFSYSFNNIGLVKIDSFEILPEENAVFSEAGNLIKEEGADGWLFLYEEPGQPALRVLLQFTPNSRCQATDGPIACDDWGSGDRVKIDGQRTGNRVVVNLAIEQESEKILVPTDSE